MAQFRAINNCNKKGESKDLKSHSRPTKSNTNRIQETVEIKIIVGKILLNKEKSENVIIMQRRKRNLG